MLLNIIHRTRYRYSQPVFLEPFTVRLRPRCDASQTLRSYRIDVTPSPSGITHCLGLYGNNTETIWFSGLHENLLIEVHTLVETHHGNPFDFFVTDPAALTLPLEYDPQLARALGHYLARNGDHPGLAAFAQEMMQAARHETIPFLTLLAEEIYQRLEYMLREHGDPWTPEETLEQGKGSCRDFAMLFIDICRSVGIAARFVSGYCIGDAAAGSDMHAWAEVYLPGPGWKGFDPTIGELTARQHIPVAVARHPEWIPPVAGSFVGSTQVPTLTVNVQVTAL